MSPTTHTFSPLHHPFIHFFQWTHTICIFSISQDTPSMFFALLLIGIHFFLAPTNQTYFIFLMGVGGGPSWHIYIQTLPCTHPFFFRTPLYIFSSTVSYSLGFCKLASASIFFKDSLFKVFSLFADRRIYFNAPKDMSS